MERNPLILVFGTAVVLVVGAYILLRKNIPQVGSSFPQDHAAQMEARTPGIVSLLTDAANRYGIDSNILIAQAWAESQGKADAVSSAGAQGVMQLMPDTATALGVNDPFDPAQNIDGGAKYLADMVGQFGTYTLGLAAYNAGPGNVKKYGGIPPFAETQNYVAKILSDAGVDESV